MRSLYLTVLAGLCATFLYIQPARAGAYSWNTPQATILPGGDLAWAPQPFAYTPGASIRYIDFENGNDSNAGTSTNAAWRHHPWDPNATGTAAAASGIHTYVFKRGVIYRGQLLPDDSGAAGNPIRLTSDPAWGSGEACLYGSERVTNWQRGPTGVHTNIPSPGSVWFADLAFLPRMVCMVDATGGITRMPLARQPNWTITDPTDPLRNCWRWDSRAATNLNGSARHLGMDSMLNNPDPNFYTGGLVWTEWGNLMSGPYAATIEARDAARNGIVLQGPWGTDSGSLIINHRYWLEDKPHYLDQAGEFWFHKTGASSGRLYLRLPGDRAPTNVIVEAARHVELIYKYLGSAWNHIEISGLTFRFGNIYWPLEYRNFMDYPKVTSAAIHIEGSGVGITVRNCVFEYISEAVRITAYQSTDRMDDLLVADNDIRSCDHGALALADGSGYNQYSRPGALGLVRVLRNRIRDTGLRPFRVNGHHTLHVNFAERAEIAGNILERVGGSGLFIFGGKASTAAYDVPLTRILMFNNKAADTLLCANDWGGIETWQGGTFYVYNNVSHNPLARQNFAISRFGAAYYLDGAFKNYFFNNIAWGTQSWVLNQYIDAPYAFQQVLGHFNTFFNNSASGFKPTFHQQSSSTGREKFLGNIVDASKTYVFDHVAASASANYDTLAYDWNVITRMNNNFGRFEYGGAVYATLGAFAGALNTRKAMAWATGTQTVASVVADAGNRDFRPLAGSAALDAAGRVFVPWTLARTEGEWHFSLNRNTPDSIYNEAWYMRAAYVDRENYQYMPTLPLTCVNIGAADYVASPLDTWAPGALRFDGATQYAYSPGSGPNGMTLDIGTNGLIIELIFRTVPGHTGGVLVAKAAADGYVLDLDAAGRARFDLYQGGAAVFTRTSGVTVNDGAWHHLLLEFVRPAPAQLNLFVDGVPANGAASGTLPLAAVPINNTAQFLVGRGTSGAYFAGEIDFLRVAHGSLADAFTSIAELYDWQFGGPALADFRGLPPNGRRDAGALEAAYAGEAMPQITRQLTNVVLDLGAGGGLRVAALDAEYYQWAKDSQPFAAGTNPALVFAAADAADAGVYTLSVSNAAGAATSAPITVTVIPEPVVGIAALLLCVCGCCARPRLL